MRRSYKVKLSRERDLDAHRSLKVNTAQQVLRRSHNLISGSRNGYNAVSARNLGANNININVNQSFSNSNFLNMNGEKSGREFVSPKDVENPMEMLI